MERVIRRSAHAKLNVSLHVLGRRDDGYHDIESVIVPVSLADEMTFRAAPELRLTVRGDVEVPADEGNLVVIAAEALAAACGIEAGADVELDKRIPAAAGLGGGSADAAATLLALNELWGCGLEGDDLLELAAALGSDVPALLPGGPVLVGGRGEIVEPAEVEPSWWVLLPQPFALRTSDVYRWWDEAAGPRDPAGVNDLEPPVVARHPEVAAAKDRLLAEGARRAMLCGSGPTVAGLADDEQEARRIAASLPGAIAVSAPP